MILDKIIEMIKSLTDEEFYGSIEIKFEKGMIIIVNKKETIKFYK